MTAPSVRGVNPRASRGSCGHNGRLAPVPATSAVASVTGMSHVPSPPPRLVDPVGVARRQGFRRAGLVVVAGLTLARLCWLDSSEHLDFSVYRRGAADVAAGLSPYQDAGGLPFTYPPFAALAFRPLTWVDAAVGQVLFLGTNLTAYAAVVLVSAVRLGIARRALPWWFLGGVHLAPVARHLGLGQVNLILVALVVIDLLVVPTSRRGWLVGIAAALKIVPGIFVVLLLVRREWSAALRSGCAAALATACGWWVAPEASDRFFRALLWDPVRVGGLSYADNQSLIGVTARALATNPPPAWVGLPLEVGAVAVGLLAAERCHRAHDEVGAVLMVAMGSLLASPVSWSHHWVWVVPVAMWLTAQRELAGAVVAVGVTLVEPLTLSGLVQPWPEPYGPWLAQVACALMPTTALVLLLIAIRRRGDLTGRPGGGRHTPAVRPPTRSGPAARRSRADRRPWSAGRHGSADAAPTG